MIGINKILTDKEEICVVLVGFNIDIFVLQMEQRHHTCIVNMMRIIQGVTNGGSWWRLKR